MIYGMALLAGCMFVGTFLGDLLGFLTGLNSNIGGVGFAMILLLLLTNSPKANRLLPVAYSKGITFWKEMYIPVTIAMSASQNVVSALDGGFLALTAGVGIVLIMLFLIPLFNKFIPKTMSDEENMEVAK